jgi:hypothetical protein
MAAMFSSARNATVCPGSTTRPARAASTAAKMPSAMPTCASTAHVWAMCSTSRSDAVSAPP